MEKAWEYAAPLHLAFVDLKKAFDSVPRDALWRVLRAYGLPALLVELLQDLHTGTEAAVRVGTTKGASFPVTAGVRQGCVIAPLLFNVYIDFVVKQALARMPAACGVAIAYGFDGSLAPQPAARATHHTHISLLMYADDMAITCPSAEQLLHFLHVMDDVCAEGGLYINAAKTEVMSVDRKVADPLPANIQLRGGPVQQVKQFKYLGSLVAADCTLEADVNARVAKAGAAFIPWQTPQANAAPACTAPAPDKSSDQPYCYVPPTVSKEAQEFLRTTSVGPYLDFSTPAAAAKTRAERLKGQPPAAQALRDVSRSYFNGVASANETVGGVPCVTAGADTGGPVVLYLHGGAYTLFSCAQKMWTVAPAAQKAGGLRVVCADYRKAPEAPFPAALDDAEAVWRALAAKHGARRVAIAGDSAGGGLALALLLRLAWARRPLPAALVLYSPWADLAPDDDTSVTLRGPDPRLSYPVNLASAARAYVGGDTAKFADPFVSPARADWSKSAVGGEMPPMLLQIGTRDTFLSAAARLTRRLRRAGHSGVELSLYEGMWHVWQAYLGVPEALEAAEEAAGFLRRHLGLA